MVWAEYLKWVCKKKKLYFQQNELHFDLSPYIQGGIVGTILGVISMKN
jgi:hypothetical protein